MFKSIDLIRRKLATSLVVNSQNFYPSINCRVSSTGSFKPPKLYQTPSKIIEVKNVAPFEVSRGSHSDMPFPDMDKYRRKSTKNPCESGRENSYNTRVFSYIPAAFMFTAGLYAAKAATVFFIDSMSPAADVLALAKAEIKLGAITPGNMLIAKWRGRPLFVRHRISEEWEKERAFPLSSLRDPEKDEDRVKKPEWLVVIGVCTHLGCVPIANAGDFKAFFCPCHGSHFDFSGRVRKGPAPRNLEVPKYEFLDDDTLLVG